MLCSRLGVTNVADKVGPRLDVANVLLRAGDALITGLKEYNNILLYYLAGNLV